MEEMKSEKKRANLENAQPLKYLLLYVYPNSWTAEGRALAKTKRANGSATRVLSTSQLQVARARKPAVGRASVRSWH